MIKKIGIYENLSKEIMKLLKFSEFMVNDNELKC